MRLLLHRGTQGEQVQTNFLGVRRGLPKLPCAGRVAREYRADRDRVALRLAAGVVGAVGVERILDRQAADRAKRRLWVAGVRVAGFALILGVEPACSAAIRT